MTRPGHAVELAGRDLAIVQAVARFKQLPTRTIYELLFSTSSRTPCYDALRRLADKQYLHPIERRAVGGRRGGSGQLIYSLGRRGFYMFNDGGFRPARTIDYHALYIAETFMALRRLQVAGRLEIAGYSTEPHCHQSIGGVLLTPDLFIELADTAGRRMPLWLEIDMGTEGQRQLREKLAKYWRAYKGDTETWPVHRTVFIAIDDERAKELRWLIGQGTDEQRELFNVATLPDFIAMLTGDKSA